MQAARGAAIADETAAPEQGDRRRALLVLVAVALTGLTVDVVSKVLAVEHLSDRPDVPVIGDLLVLHLTRNPGAAFSTGTEFTIALSLLAIVAVLVVLYLTPRVRSVLWGTAFGFLLAGVGGNLVDRIFRAPAPLEGHVVDFLMLPNWPVFNVADICINVAAGLILLQAFRGRQLDGTKAPAEDRG